MNKFFCTGCGHKNIYEIEKPKFCAGCGKKIGSSILERHDDEGIDEEYEGFAATKLDVEIEGEGRLDLSKVIQERRNSYPVSTNETKR